MTAELGIGTEVEEAEEGMVGAGLCIGGESVCRGGADWTCADVLGL